MSIDWEVLLEAVNSNYNIPSKLLEYIRNVKNDEIKEFLSLLYSHITTKENPDLVYRLTAAVVCSLYKTNNCADQRILSAIRDVERYMTGVEE